MDKDHKIDPLRIADWRKAQLSPKWLRFQRTEGALVLSAEIPQLESLRRKTPVVLAYSALCFILLIAYAWMRYSKLNLFPQSFKGLGLLYAAAVLIILTLWYLRRRAAESPTAEVPGILPLTVHNNGDVIPCGHDIFRISSDDIIAIEFVTITGEDDLAALRIIITPIHSLAEPGSFMLAAGSKDFIEAFAKVFDQTPHTIHRTAAPLICELERSTERARDHSNPEIPLDAANEEYWHTKAHWIRRFKFREGTAGIQLNVTLPSLKQPVILACVTIGALGAIAAGVISQGNRGGSYIIDLRLLAIPAALLLTGIIAHRIFQIALRASRKPLISMSHNGAASLGWHRNQDFDADQVLAIQLATGTGIYKDPEELIQPFGQTIEQLRLIVKDPTTPTGIAAIPIVTAPILGYDRLQAHFAKVGIDLQRRDVPQATLNDPHHR